MKYEFDFICYDKDNRVVYRCTRIEEIANDKQRDAFIANCSLTLRKHHRMTARVECGVCRPAPSKIKLYQGRL